MGGAKTEVAADLVVNDLASKTLNHVKAGFGGIQSKLAGVKSSMLGFAKHTATTALGVSMAGIVPTVKGWAEGAIEAAMEAGKEEKALAASMMMTDRKGRSYQSMRDDAVGLRKELREMGMEAGISATAMVDSFSDIAARSTHTSGEITKMMGEMAQAARIVPGGLASITQGFEMIEMGVIRARNPVVMLVASSGLLAGNAKQVALQMQKMAPEKQMKLAEKAIGLMAQKMRGVPLSFAESLQSMRDMKEELIEMVGMPMFKALTPIMHTFRDEFKSHRVEIEAFAEMVGSKAGDAVKVVGDKVRDIFKDIGAHWGEIASAISTAGNALMGAAKFVVENREAMLNTFLASQTRGVSAFVTPASTAGGVVGGVVGGAAGGGPMGAAVGAVGSLFTQVKSLGEELPAKFGPFLRLVGPGGPIGDAMGRYGDRLSTEYTSLIATATANERRIAELNKEHAAMAPLADAQEKYIQSMVYLQNRLRFGTGMGAESPEKSTHIPAVGFATTAKASMEIMDEETKAISDSMAKNFAQMFDQAQAVNDQVMMMGAIRMLGGSAELQYALAASGVMVKGGFDALIKAAEEGGDAVLIAGLKTLKKAREGGGKAAAPTIHVGGGNNVNIKQEFREADPDRILIAMKHGISKAVTSRISARVSVPFGF